MKDHLTKKLIKLSMMFVMVLALGLGIKPVNVEASLGNPTIVANIKVNGVLTPLGNNTATTTVTLVSDRPVIFYLYDNAITENYSTTTTIEKGFGTFKYSAVDQQGRMSDAITVKLDLNQEPILTGNFGTPGLESVTLNAMKEAYYVINGVKETSLNITKVISARGDYTIYAESKEGLRSNTVTFSIPTKGTPTTTTTTTKVTTKTTPRTTTKGNPSTTGPVTPSIALNLKNVVDGGSANQDVTIEAAEKVFFIVNGKKEATAKKSLTLSEEGSYIISAENAKKNVSEEVTFVIDKTAPTVELLVNGSAQAPGVFKEAVTLQANEQGVFLVNGTETYGTNNAITLSESGSYTVEFKDLADNKTSIDFVLDIQKEPEPTKPEQKDSSWMLYLIIGLVAGAGVALGGSYFLNKKK